MTQSRDFPSYSINPSVPKLFMKKPTLEMPPALLGRFRGFYVVIRNPYTGGKLPEIIFLKEPMTTILIIVVVLMLFGGGGYYGYRRW